MDNKERVFNADSKETILQSLSDAFNGDTKTIQALLDQISPDKENASIDAILESYNIIFDKVSLYHLTRRLVDDNDYSSKPLPVLLTTTNAFSSFLANYGITFSYENDIIHLFRDGQVVDLDTYGENSKAKINGTIPRLKDRFGLSSWKDYGVNGFAFATDLKNSTYSYYNNLEHSADLLSDIEQLLNLHGLCQEFNNNSNYFCYKYHVSLNDVCLIGTPNLSIEEKSKRILKIALYNLLNITDGNLRLRYLNDQTLGINAFQKRWLIG